ncbi:unnamed protein product [Timema podura]|uniref:Mitoferrin-1 n=1 Tax=Timema podura TaxID=61482 RepID=A0ABN7NJR3_TIMPD|nr:unnamed protein product [Timema podura]
METPVVKQRMQMYNSPYKAVLECMVKIYRTEGVRAFYRSYTTQLTMNVPFQSIHFMMYESMQNLTNPDNQYNPAAHMVSGACAGAVAAAVTTPLDVCKTFLNTQPLLVGQTGLVHAVRTVYKLGGARGYFRGVQARVLFQMPATAICWSVYELFKYLLLAKPADIDLDLRLEDSAELKLFPEIKSVAPMPSAAPIKTIEMPSVSGASIYGALSLNTMHNSDNGVSQTGLLRDMRHS